MSGISWEAQKPLDDLGNLRIQQDLKRDSREFKIRLKTSGNHRNKQKRSGILRITCGPLGWVENLPWLPGFALSFQWVDRVCPALLAFRRLVCGKLSAPLLAHVVIAPLQLPGQLTHRGGQVWGGLVCGGAVQLADVVAVFGRVVLQGSSSAAFLTLELQHRQHASKFTHHPVLKPESTWRQSSPLFLYHFPIQPIFTAIIK